MTYKERVKELNDLRIGVSCFLDDLEKRADALISYANSDIDNWKNSKARDVYEEYKLTIKDQAVNGYDNLVKLIENLTNKINELKILEKEEYDKFKYLTYIGKYDELDKKRYCINSEDIDGDVKKKLLYDLECNASLIKTYPGMN
ncbi:MAG: hypothetical protein ACRCWM_10635 [Sarcina sp.]